jgi:hypothetical protein
MKLAFLAIALASVGSAGAPDRLGEKCTGTETVQIGSQPPKTLAYSLNFSADLKSNLYCYDKFGRDQTYAIADADSNTIKLADLDHGGQIRYLTFDRSSSMLTDYQVFDAGLAMVMRSASAMCRATTFHEPWAPPESRAR